MANLTSRNGVYYLEWRDDLGKHQRRSTGTKNRASAEKLLKDFDGKTPAALPLVIHLKDFMLHVATTNQPQQVTLIRSRIEKVLGIVGCTKIDQLTASRVTQAVKGLTHHQTGRPLSAESRAKYVKVMKQFSRWLHSERRCPLDVLIGLKNRWGASGGTRCRLSDQELRALFGYLESATKTLLGFSPSDRLRIYKLAVGSGLRRSELSYLTREWVDLSARTLTVPAGVAKSKREDVVVLGGEFAGWLGTWLPCVPLGQELFPRLRVVRPASMLRRDLRDAGVVPGRVVDFHCLRHTFSSQQWEAGLTAAEVMSQTRHTTLKVASIYAHADLGKLRQKLA